MSQEILSKFAQLQTENRNQKQDIKRYSQMLLARDEEIKGLKKELDKKQELIDFLNKQLKEERELNDKKPRRKK